MDEASSLKLVHLCRLLPAHEPGGMQGHAWDLARTFAGQGHRVAFLTTALKPHLPTDKVAEIEGVKTTFLAGTRPQRYSPAYYQATVEALEVLCQGEGRPDLVHSQSTAAYGLVEAGLPERRGIPLVVTLHGTHQMEVASRLANASLTRPKQWAWAQWSRIRLTREGHTWGTVYLQKAARIISVSDTVRDQAVAEYELEPTQVVTVPNGVDTDYFHPGEPKEGLARELGLEPDLPVVLFLSRMELEKGPQVLLEAWGRLGSDPPGQLLMVGRGPALAGLRYKLKKEGLRRVVVAGGVAQSELADCYRLARLYCLPTLRQEGLPLAVLEAMASGLPVVASPKGGLAAVVDNKVGRLVEPEPEALAETLERLLADEELCSRLGAAARSRAERDHSLAAMAQATLQVYQKALASF